MRIEGQICEADMFETDRANGKCFYYTERVQAGYVPDQCPPDVRSLVIAGGIPVCEIEYVL